MSCGFNILSQHLRMNKVLRNIIHCILQCVAVLSAKLAERFRGVKLDVVHRIAKPRSSPSHLPAVDTSTKIASVESSAY